MCDYEKIENFQNKILSWYGENGRNFYWREHAEDSYIVLISEILLQRTKAETVSKYLPTFLEQFPSWDSLGNATEKKIVQALVPVGLYNQKGTRLYNLAQAIKQRKGSLPKSRAEIIRLPLIGQYIANAYGLFILNQPNPLLDVNMARLLERYFGPRKLADIRYDPYLQNLAHEVINHRKPKELNWGILDFGAMICIKNNPKCSVCVLKSHCLFYQSNLSV